MLFVCKVTFSGVVKSEDETCSRVEIRFRPGSHEGTTTQGEGLPDQRFYFYLLNNAVKDSSLRVVQLNQGLYQLMFIRGFKLSYYYHIHIKLCMSFQGIEEFYFLIK